MEDCTSNLPLKISIEWCKLKFLFYLHEDLNLAGSLVQHIGLVLKAEVKGLYLFHCQECSLDLYDLAEIVVTGGTGNIRHQLLLGKGAHV